METHETTTNGTLLSELARERQPQHRLEEALDGVEDRANNTIQLVAVNRKNRHFAGQKNRILGSDSEPRPYKPEVLTEQERMQVGLVLRGSRQHIGFVLERPLAKCEPNCGEVTLLTSEAHVPPSIDTTVASHVDDCIVRHKFCGKPSIDCSLCARQLRGSRQVVAHWSRLAAVDETARAKTGKETLNLRGGATPGVGLGPLSRRVAHLESKQFITKDGVESPCKRTRVTI